MTLKRLWLFPVNPTTAGSLARMASTNAPIWLSWYPSMVESTTETGNPAVSRDLAM